MFLGLIQRIGDARSLALKQEPVISHRANNTAEDGSEERNNEIVVVRGKHLRAVQEGGKNPRAKVSRGIEGLKFFSNIS